MGDDDERTRAIIERARLRKEELDAEDEKGSSISDQSLETPATLHVTKKVTWSAECLSTPETPEPDTDTPPKSECTLTRRKIFAELSAEYDEYDIDYSPIRTVALENAATKKILPVLEERIRETPVKNLPMPKLPGDAIASSKPKTPAKSLWKASTNVPVVVGARPGEPTRADVCPASLKSLKERWEVSSMTGTPLHPDDTKEDLIQAAMKRRESLNPKKMKTRAAEQTGSSSITKAERSITSSPIAKSPRCEVVSPASQRSPAASSPTSDLSPVAKDDDHPDNLDSEPNYSKAIDEAFDFMTGSPIRTPSRGDSPKNYHSPIDDAKKFERSEAGKGLHYTLSYYRQRTRQEQSSVSSSEKVDLSINHSVSSPPTSSEDLSSEPEIDIGERKKHLQNVIFTQQTKSGQALKALQLSWNKAQFRGSHEEATAQWAILIESELGRAAEEELERLNSQELFVRTGPFGSLTLSNIIVELNRDFIDRNSHYRSEEVFYFCIILRSGEQVLHSAIISSEDAVKRGFIEVAPPMALKNLPRDFTASLDVYSFRTIRGHYTHEEKFGLKGSSTTKHKSASRPTSSSAGRGDSCFVPVGKLPLDINIPNGKKRLQLSDVTYPLGGHVSIKIKKVATRLTTGNHSGFLSLFHRPGEGLGSWTRYWCVLESGGMKFWRQPEDAAQNKKWIVILDLTTCAGEKEGASENNDPGQYLNPFHIDVWIPKNESSLNQTECGEMEKFRILLSADTKDDMHAWLNAINSSVDVLRSWT